MSEHREMTVTIKGGKEFSSPWIVAGGLPSEIRDQIVQAFSLDAEQVEGLSLAELTVEASRIFQGMFQAQEKLGGKILAKGTGPAKAEEPAAERPAPKAKPAAKPKAAKAPVAAEKEPEAPAPQAEPESPSGAQTDPLLAEIAAAEDMKAITAIWKANQAAFKTRKDVAEAVKARRAEIGA